MSSVLFTRSYRLTCFSAKKTVLLLQEFFKYLDEYVVTACMHAVFINDADLYYTHSYIKTFLVYMRFVIRANEIELFKRVHFETNVVPMARKRLRFFFVWKGITRNGTQRRFSGMFGVSISKRPVFFPSRFQFCIGQ